MFRTRTSSPPPPNHLRRRYHTVNQWQEDEGVRLSTQDFGPSGQASLDLSIHHPSHSFGTIVPAPGRLSLINTTQAIDLTFFSRALRS